MKSLILILSIFFISTHLFGQSIQEKYYPQGTWYCSKQSNLDRISIIKHIGESNRETTLSVTFIYKSGIRIDRNYVYGGIKGTYYSNYFQNGTKFYSEITILKGDKIQERLINKTCESCDVEWYNWTK